MSWVAVGTAVVGAGLSYAEKKKQKKAAEKAAKAGSSSTETTTRTPYREDLLGPDLGSIIDIQRGLIGQGAPQVGKDGKVYYAQLPTASGGGGAGAGAAAPTNFTAAQQRQIAKGKLTPQQAAKRNAKAGGGGGKAAASAGGGGAPAPSGPAPKSAEDIFREVAARGMGAGDTETIGQGRDAIGNILGAAGGGGPEETGFEGYNPILDRLAGTLEGDVGSRSGQNLLLDFLGAQGGTYSGGGASGSGGARGGGASVRRSSSQQNADGSWTTARAGANPPGGSTPGGHGGPAPPSASNPEGGWGGNLVPDAAGVGLFGQEARKIFDEEGNAAEMEEMIRLMNEDVEKGMFRDMAALDAAAMGAGRLGGDTWKGVSRDAREEGIQEMLKNAAGVRVGDREARRQARLAALGQVGNRDLGALQGVLSREGMASNERIASSNASAAGAGASEAAALQRRAQDLSAIGALMENERFSLGQLGDVGGQLSGDRLSALGMVPGIEGIGLSGLNVALGGGGGLTDLRGIAQADAASRRSANVASAGQRQQLGMFNAGQQQGAANDYLRTVMGIGGMGGTVTGAGTQTAPPGYVGDPWAAAIQGGLGGAAIGQGFNDQYRRTQPSGR